MEPFFSAVPDGLVYSLEHQFRTCGFRAKIFQ